MKCLELRPKWQCFRKEAQALEQCRQQIIGKSSIFNHCFDPDKCWRNGTLKILYELLYKILSFFVPLVAKKDIFSSNFSKAAPARE